MKPGLTGKYGLETTNTLKILALSNLGTSWYLVVPRGPSPMPDFGIILYKVPIKCGRFWVFIYLSIIICVYFFLCIGIFVSICLFRMDKKVVELDKVMGITVNEINIFVIVDL